MNINKVFIYGNLTRDPEVTQMPNGTSVARLGIATNRTYKNQQGEKVEDTEYHSVTMFARLAELSQQYLKKGSGLFVEGRLKTSSWEVDGVKKYRTEIIAEQMQFGPRKNSESSSDSNNYENSDSVGDADNSPKQTPTINPDDIPF